MGADHSQGKIPGSFTRPLETCSGQQRMTKAPQPGAFDISARQCVIAETDTNVVLHINIDIP